MSTIRGTKHCGRRTSSKQGVGEVKGEGVYGVESEPGVSTGMEGGWEEEPAT